jgi:adenylosuccinate lyase
MPFKRNPIRAEKIDSLARNLAQMPRIAWDNAAHSLLERTLDDSANRRSLLPEAFLICDELLTVGLGVVKHLQFDPAAAARNLATYGPFAGQEPLLMALVKAGADRQAFHERLREHAMAAWKAIHNGQANPLQAFIVEDAEIRSYIEPDEIKYLLAVETYLGDAPQRAINLAQEIREMIGHRDT